MPVYLFECPNCFSDHKKIFSIKERPSSIQCPCGGQAEFKLSSSSSAQVMETRDPNTGKQVVRGIEKSLKERSAKHHDEYELQEKIDKHGLDTATRHGWLKKIKRT